MRDLTTPIVEQQATQQYVSDGQYHIEYENGAISQGRTYYKFKVTNLPSGNHQWKAIALADFPPAFKTKLKELHNMVTTYAENQGMLGAGTDTDDL